MVITVAYSGKAFDRLARNILDSIYKGFAWNPIAEEHNTVLYVRVTDV
jgi:hypothetical protein